MGKRYLVDSNVIIKTATRGFINEHAKTLVAGIIDAEFNISVITRIEVSSKDNSLNNYLNTANVYPLNEQTIIKTIELRQKHKIKLPDAIIAATAVVHNLTLLTNNTRDFKNIKGLTTVDPFVM